MQFNGKKKLVSAVILMASLSSLSWAAEAEPLESRVERLERIIQGQGLMNLITRVDQLQNEIQRLNGDNEALRHELKQMQDRQRQMYIDLDERLQQQTQVGPAPALAPQVVQQPVEQPQMAMTETPDSEPTLASESAPAPVAVESGEAAYQAALQTLRSGQYEQAVKLLAVFPEQYPQSTYLPNAYYWQGEAKYVLRQFAEAAALFQIVIDQYPASTKVADALLKRGFSEDEMGDATRAKQTLSTVIEQYPDSSAARLAKVRLDRINQEAR